MTVLYTTLTVKTPAGKKNAKLLRCLTRFRVAVYDIHQCKTIDYQDVEYLEEELVDADCDDFDMDLVHLHSSDLINFPTNEVDMNSFPHGCDSNQILFEHDFASQGINSQHEQHIELNTFISTMNNRSCDEIFQSNSTYNSY